MQLETERLILIPLTPEQLRLWTRDLPALEKALSCSYQAEPMEPWFVEIINGQAALAAADEANYLYRTFWFLLRKSDRVIVGSVCFKGAPNDAGEVEIGYGLGSAFEHQGYMTEAVRAMCDWALTQSDVTEVIAETEVGGLASENILKCCGFVQYQSGETNWWRLKR